MEESIENNINHNSCIRTGIVKTSDIFILLIGIYFFMYSIIYGTNFYQMTKVSSIISSMWSLIWIGIKILIFIKVLAEYQRRDWKVIVLLLFSIVLSFKADGAWFTDAVWIICALKHVNYRSLLKCVFFALIMSFACIVGLCFIGKISDDTFYRGESAVRHSFGYQHPNTLAIRVFELCAIFVCIKQKRLRYVHSIVFFAVMIIVKYFTDSTSAVTMLGALAFSVLFICYANKTNNGQVNSLKKIVRFCMDKVKYIILLMPVLATIFVINSSLLKTMVSGTLLSRVIQAENYYTAYGIKVFGNVLQINNKNDNWSLISNLYTLDNAYMYMLLGYGIIAFILFLYAEVKLFLLFARKRNYEILTVLALYAIYGFMEIIFIRMDMNFTLLFIGILIWGYKKEIKI